MTVKELQEGPEDKTKGTQGQGGKMVKATFLYDCMKLLGFFFLDFFFYVDHLKIFIEFVTILLLFYVLVSLVMSHKGS